MFISYSPEHEQLRRELRSYFSILMTPERRAALATGGDYGDGEVYKQVVRQMGKDGWLTLGWPEEFGGRGGSALEQLIFTDEAAIAGAPVPFLTINTVGPTIMRFGTPEQKAFYLPKIASGELHFAIGYSEPDAGTDLASLRTRAVRTGGTPGSEGVATGGGDEYVINGQKMWTSLIQYADYVWLACRTDPDALRHKGLSILIVPTSSEGFSYTPVHTVSGPSTSATYYSDVRVPATNVVGEENKGWALITNQLNHERVALTSAAPIMNALREVREWAQQTKLSPAGYAPTGGGAPIYGRRVIDQEWVQIHLARVHAKVQFLRLKNWQIASGSDLGPADASATKVFGTEFATEAYRLLGEVLGANGYVRMGSPAAVLAGRVERMARASLILTFGGGTNEVQRDIIAGVGLRLPASGR